MANISSSQASFIIESVASFLTLELKSKNISVTGVVNTPTNIKQTTSATTNSIQ